MSLTVLDMLFAAGTTAAGSAATWWVAQHRNSTAAAGDHAREAADVLGRLHDLANRVAVEVDDHNTQVRELSHRLAETQGQEPAKVVDVVARLIEANQQMQEKLNSTESKLRQQAQQMQAHMTEARTDALTLLSNRRAFDDEIARRAAEFRRQGRAFSLTMVDVDHFKKFNDAHGHQAGDEVLQEVARMLRRKMREMDMVARYGGEEFAIIHPGTSIQEACKAALRACLAIDKAALSVCGKQLHVTASLGVAEVIGNEEPAALIARADKALYACKNGGRNCVYWHDGQTTHRVEGGPSPARDAAAASDITAPDGASAAVPARERADGGPARLDPSFFVNASSTATLIGRTIFCQQVRARMAEWKRGGPTFSVALIAVNQYDKTSGIAGQQMREMASLAGAKYLTGTIREMDVLGNYGPGCFALLLPTAKLADSIRVAERLRDGFAAYTSPSPEESPRFTFSVSVVQTMQRDDSLSLLQRAEAALATADRRGGNRAYYHDGERSAPITAMLEAMGYLA